MATRGPQRQSVLFTDDNVLAFPAPRSGAPLIYRDEAIKGLILSVSKTGVRAYKTETRTPQGGKNHGHLGLATDVSLSEARAKAVRELDKRSAEQTKTVARESGRTLEGVLDAYVKDKGITADNARRYRQVLRTYGWPFWTKSVKTITRDEVQRHRTKVRDGEFPKPPESSALGGPGCANDLCEYGSMVVSWLLGRKADNPFKDHTPYVTAEPEERYVIEPTDWGRIYQLVQRWHQDDRDMFWLHVLLGARPLGTARLRWDRVLWDKRAYRLTQDRVECQGWKPAQSPGWDYPVDNWSMDILRERHKFADPSCPFVFPSPQRRHEGGAVSTGPLTRMFDELETKLMLPSGCTPYAARYTRGTYSDALFGTGQLTAIMLNHQVDYGQRQVRKYVVVDDRTAESFGYSTIQRYVQRYSEAIQELCGTREASAEVMQKLLHR